MTQEEKEELLVDLCARLPYGIKVFYEYVDGLNKKTYGYSLTLNTWCIDEMKAEKAVVKPYLFPLSSMTEWKERELEILMKNSIESCGMLFPYDCLKMERFFNENHLDWRGLITKGLAIDATGLNIY